MMGDSLGLNEVMFSNNIPAEFLAQILSHLPQKHLVMCREVCPYWRDVIDLHCPMKDIIVLEQDDKFLSRKLELRMTSCALDVFHRDTPNISLTQPQTIKSFEFCQGHWDYEEVDLNIENARGLLSQIKPFVEILKLETRYLENNVLSPPFLFRKVRKLQIGHEYLSHNMRVNLEILFSHRFPSLEKLHLCFNYLDEKLMDEAYANCFCFKANHRHTLKHLVKHVHYGVDDSDIDDPDDLPVITRQYNLSREVKRILLKGELRLETLNLSLPPKYAPAWAQFLKTQKKLMNLIVEYREVTNGPGPGGVPFYGIASGISSSVITLRIVHLKDITSVGSDGVTWIPLDLSVFKGAVNLTEFMLERNQREMDRDGTPVPDEDKGAEIINLQEIKSASLTLLEIFDFVCNSDELQNLVDNAPILESLFLQYVQAPRTSSKFAETGVHGGIIHSFLEKESKLEIEVHRSLNVEHEEQNKKFEAVKVLHPAPNDNINDLECFYRSF